MIFAYVTGFRGDWKALKQLVNLNRHYSTERICFWCSATKGADDFNHVFTNVSDDAPYWQDLYASAPWGDRPHYADLIGFHISMVFPDLLHVYHLGVGRDMLGSILRSVLSEPHVFAGPTIDDRFQSATDQLRAFARARKLPLRLHKLSRAKISWKSRTFPELNSSGYDTYVVGSWLENELLPHTDRYPDFTTLLWSANHSLGVLSKAGRWLTTLERDNVRAAGRVFMQTYMRLAGDASAQGSFLFRVRPKTHLLHHLFRSHRPSRLNCYVYSTWMDEDFLKKIAKVLKLTSQKSAQHRCLQRWLLGMPEVLKRKLRNGLKGV